LHSSPTRKPTSIKCSQIQNQKHTHTHTHTRNTHPKTQTLSPFSSFSLLSFWSCRNLPGSLAWEKRKVAAKGGLNYFLLIPCCKNLLGFLGAGH
jgi:hypothetical protein